MRERQGGVGIETVGLAVCQEGWEAKVEAGSHRSAELESASCGFVVG